MHTYEPLRGESIRNACDQMYHLVLDHGETAQMEFNGVKVLMTRTTTEPEEAGNPSTDAATHGS